jgi:drug/metabolite transporter (DMT)-like permease
VFFLMPPVTAVLAWLLLDETLDVREIVGLVITVLGVAAATRSARVEEFEPVAPDRDPD